ncbi:MAG: hypothetical protein U0169_10165 [Polyangiaceae bacterium]
MTTTTVTRRVVHGEARAWLRENGADPGTSVVTSLPDVSEIEGMDIAAWRAWFLDTARAVIRWVPEGGVAVFYQSDVRHRGVWIDKGYLVLRAADDEGAPILWHKIVCRKPAGTVSHGRATYSHMIAVAKGTFAPPRHGSVDVLPSAGTMTWSRAMGVEACRVACTFLRDETSTRIVVDPFCGKGTALAVANAFGFDAIGIELSVGRCRTARNLAIP